MAKETKKTKKHADAGGTPETAGRAGKKKAAGNGSELTPQDLARFRDLLLQKRREIVSSVTEINNEALNPRMAASGDLSSMPIHMADLGSDTFEQELELDLMDSERKLLREIDDALRRIADNTYGLCEASGNPIMKARLEAQPWARHCVQHARELEQGKIIETEF